MYCKIKDFRPSVPCRSGSARRRPRIRRAGTGRRWLAAVLGAGAILTAGWAIAASDRLPGPVPARLARVIDGDTVVVRAHVWLGHEVEVLVRIAGIDAPERRGRCAAEREQAAAARAFVEAKLDDGALTLHHIRYGKYAGRVIADVANAAGEDVATAVLVAGLARAYEAGKRADWCGEEGDVE